MVKKASVKFPTGAVVYARAHNALATVVKRTKGKVTLTSLPDGAPLPGEATEGELMSFEEFVAWAKKQPWYQPLELPPDADLSTSLRYVEQVVRELGQKTGGGK